MAAVTDWILLARAGDGFPGEAKPLDRRLPVASASSSPESESCFSVASSVASPMAVWNRRAGSFLRQRSTMRARSRGRVALISVRGGG